VKSARRARAASSAAAANASSAARNAAQAAQSAASLAQTAAQNAAVLAASAAQKSSGAAQTAATGVSKGVKQGVYSARVWTAPRLDSAAEYCTTTVAPKVSSVLHSAASQVRPEDVKRSKRSSILTWSLLGAAVATALGAAAAMVRYRDRTAIEADSEIADEEVLGDSTGSQAAPLSTDDGARPTAPSPRDPRDPSKEPNKTDPTTETSVNGRVASSGW
jgi:trimeric autotransporter adhesin